MWLFISPSMNARITCGSHTQSFTEVGQKLRKLWTKIHGRLEVKHTFLDANHSMLPDFHVKSPEIVRGCRFKP